MRYRLNYHKTYFFGCYIANILAAKAAKAANLQRKFNLLCVANGKEWGNVQANLLKVLIFTLLVRSCCNFKCIKDAAKLFVCHVSRHLFGSMVQFYLDSSEY